MRKKMHHILYRLKKKPSKKPYSILFKKARYSAKKKKIL